MSSGGGKGGSKSVPQIDPTKLINQAIAANRVGVNTPYGSQAYSTDANGKTVLNTTLSPEMQAILAQQIQRAGAPAQQYTLPQSQRQTLNGLNQRLDQRYGMGLPPAPPPSNVGSSGPGNTTPGTTPPIGTPGGLPPSTTPGSNGGTGGNWQPGDPVGGGQANVLPAVGGGGPGYGGAILAGQQPSQPYGGGANAGQFGLPLPGYGTGGTFDSNYGGGANAAGFGLPPPTGTSGGYLGSGSYDSMGAGLRAANASSGGGHGFGWGTVKNMLDTPATPAILGSVFGLPGVLIGKLIQAKVHQQ